MQFRGIVKVVELGSMRSRVAASNIQTGMTSAVPSARRQTYTISARLTFQ
jgi:hypothetical protein